MTTENNAFETSVLQSIEKLSESVNGIKGDMSSLKGDMTSLKSDMNSRFADMNKRFADMDKRFTGMEDQFGSRFTNMENRMEKRFEQMESDLSTKIDDGIEKHANTVRYIKKYISSINEGFRPRPYSQLSVIPRSISSYTVEKVPVEPWDPPEAVSE